MYRAAFIIMAAAAGVAGAASLYDDGIVGVTKKSNHVYAEPGCFCHGDSASPGVHVWIDGPESLAAGEDGLYTVNVAKDSSVAAGFNVAAAFGSLGLAESSATQRMEPTVGDSAELTHLMPRAAAGRDTVSWMFFYRAPIVAGTIDTLYANGNSVNLSGDPDGDRWAFAPEFLVHVVPPLRVSDVPVAGGFQLYQNYPNPFNPSTTISYTLDVPSFVELSIFDLQGREITRLVNERRDAGGHAVQWNVAHVREGAGAASGIYFCRLRVTRATGDHREGFLETRKMVVLK
jgi:hypothetical protein